MGKLNLEAHGAKLGYYFICLQHRKSHLPEFTAQVVKILQNVCCGVSAWKMTTREAEGLFPAEPKLERPMDFLYYP
jgi:hypothetical protein